MKHIEKVCLVNSCSSCLFFETVNRTIECGHPYWDNKGSHSRLIIQNEHIGSRSIPSTCPLRESSVTIQIKLK